MTGPRRLIAALVALNLLLLGLGLGREKETVGTDRLRVGLVFDVGGLGDRSFNDAAHAGLVRAEQELDVAATYVEPGDGSDRESALRQLAAAGNDLVLGIGFIFTDDITRIAREFPNTSFACVDYSLPPEGTPLPPNLAALRFREEEGSFLVGAIAALTSKTGKVGFVGGMMIPLIRKFEAGYVAGVEAVCPTCEVLTAYAGTEPKAFADPTTGKELALAQYGRGADVIFHASGKTGAGVFVAAKEKGAWAIGVDADQYREAPCCILTSMVKAVDTAVYDVIADVSRGEFRGGLHEFGVAEGGVRTVDDEHNADRISPATWERVRALQADIVAGRVAVPTVPR